jgi:hypothetical protein
MNKFKVGDRVVTNCRFNVFDASVFNQCRTIQEGTEGCVLKIGEAYGAILVDFKFGRNMILESYFDLKQESEDKMEYNWHEAITHVLENNDAVLESEDFGVKMIFSNINNSRSAWLYNGKSILGIRIDSRFLNSKWTIVKPQTDWSKVAVDTKVVVWDNSSSTKFKRYFAKYENGKVHTFYNGSTSFSDSRTNGFKSWDNAELFEE